MNGPPRSSFGPPAPPLSFRLIAISSVVWMLFGVASYLMHVMMTPEQITALPPPQAELMRAMPSWLYGLFAIATWGGLAGAIALLLRRRIAVPLLLLSWIAAAAQFGYTFLGLPAYRLLGASGMIFPLIIVALGVAYWLFARTAAAKGWLR